MHVKIDPARDALLTNFGRATLQDRYLLAGETTQDLFARVARAYADDAAHAQRLYDYMSRLWFMPATPILSNGGTERGLPISCFLNAVEDNLDGIVGTWTENVWLASNGGGIGTYWGGVRSIGETVKGCGQTSGIIPFVRVMDSLTLAISQGSLRRGSAAVYLDVHPSRRSRSSSRSANPRATSIARASTCTTACASPMNSCRRCATICRSRCAARRMARCCARSMRAPLWQKILETRLQTGEPYLLFSDTANRELAAHQRELGLKVRQSNLCSEILLPTGKDHLGRARTAVCCLSSVNFETWEEWSGDPRFIEDVLRMLDNVLQDFIDHAPASMDGCALLGHARTLGGTGRHGLSFLAAEQRHSLRKRAGARREPAHVQAPAARGRCRLAGAGRGARRLPGRRGAWRARTLQPQAGHRAHRQHFGDLRRHQRLHRADSREHLHAQDAVGFVQRAQPGADQTTGGQGPGQRGHLAVHPGARGLGAAPRRA